MSSVTGSVRRDRDSKSLTLSERGGKWEGDQEREREKGRLKVRIDCNSFLFFFGA